MPWKRNSERVCLPPAVVRHLERDGLGWGHDLTAGCVRFGLDRKGDRNGKA